MKLSCIIKIAIVVLIGLAFGFGPVQAKDTIKIGMSAPKTGPMAGGAAVTQWPNLKLWAHQVNEKGGIQVGDKKMPVEIFEYDDRTQPTEAVKNIQRLITKDKVDFVVAPYGTGINLAVAPILAKYGYPHIGVSAITDKGDDFTKRWPNLFLTLGTSTGFAESVADVLKKMREQGKIGNKVAVVNVADAFGIELAHAGKPALKKAGFEIVYETSYPLGTQDLAPVINGAKNAKPDAFVAFSYPPDTFALTEQAKIANLDVKAYYVGVATCFPAFEKKFGKAAQGIFGAGGINPDTPEMQAYFKDHLEVTGLAADYWASATTYASLQIMEQAIERAKTIDHKAVIKTLKNGTFDTVMGEMTFDGNINRKFWTVGQWQDGVFYGVASTGLDGEKEPIVKKGWE